MRSVLLSVAVKRIALTAFNAQPLKPKHNSKRNTRPHADVKAQDAVIPPETPTTQGPVVTTKNDAPSLYTKSSTKTISL